MSIQKRMTDVVNQNDALYAAKAIAADIKNLSDKEIEAALYFALMKAERKGQESIAKMMASQAENVLSNIEALDQLAAI